MRTETEIKERIELVKQIKDKYRGLYINDKISRLEWIGYVHNLNSATRTLEWILEEEEEEN